VMYDYTTETPVPIPDDIRRLLAVHQRSI
jgi:hypothetical protein